LSRASLPSSLTFKVRLLLSFCQISLFLLLLKLSLHLFSQIFDFHGSLIIFLIWPASSSIVQHVLNQQLSTSAKLGLGGLSCELLKTSESTINLIKSGFLTSLKFCTTIHLTLNATDFVIDKFTYLSHEDDGSFYSLIVDET